MENLNAGKFVQELTALNINLENSERAVLPARKGSSRFEWKQSGLTKNFPYSIQNTVTTRIQKPPIFGVRLAKVPKLRSFE